jgi:SAM-dependent methyltransferase
MSRVKPKPKHLGPEYAAAFKDRSLVDVYHLRPPYSQEVLDTLVSLVTEEPRVVLDAGCGTGIIARGLIGRMERIDAVDCSEPMIAKGRSLPGGTHPALHWICGNVEDVPLGSALCLGRRGIQPTLGGLGTGPAPVPRYAHTQRVSRDHS